MRDLKVFMKRTAAFAVAGVMAVSLLGCDKSIKITMGLKDNIIFKLSDEECNLSEIMLSLVNEKNRYEKDFGIEIWEKSMGENTMEDSVKSLVKERQIYLEAIYMFAMEKGISLTEEEQQKLEQAAEVYFLSLSEEEKELLQVTKQDVYSIYKKCFLSQKVYEVKTESVDYEVSDEEARVMSAMYIYVKGTDEESRIRAEEAYGRVLEGQDFYSLAQQYSDDRIVQLEISRGDMVEEVESAAFALKPDEYTEIIQANDGYYIVKCVEDYLKDRTESSKAKILQEKKNEEFLKEFEPFLEKQKLDFNNKIWDAISLEDYDEVQTDTLFEVYEEYIG